MQEILKRTFRGWKEDDAPRLAASIAYYSTLSLAPLVIIAVSVAGLVFGRELAGQQIATQVGGLVGEQGGELVNTILQKAADPQKGIFASLLGFAVLLFGASGVFGELRDALNTIWNVKAPEANFLKQVRQRFLSFGMVLGIGFLLLVSLVVSTWLAAAGEYLGTFISEPALHVINLLISFAVTTGLFALIFKFIPDRKIPWRNVWVGSLITAALFTLGKFLIGLYLGKASVGSAYGAAGALVIMLVWVYYSALIFLFGAEFTQQWSKQ
jgi:membrane protein